MRNKKGILVKNALGAIIAIMGLVILIFAGMNIYKSFYEEKRNAQKVIDNIMGKIDNLEEGENGTFLIQGIDDWSLKGWSKDEENRPDKCFFDSCLCICPNEGTTQGLFPLKNKLHEIFIYKESELLTVSRYDKEEGMFEGEYIETNIDPSFPPTSINDLPP